MPDTYEIANGLNPFLNDADVDPDGDGLTNLQEYNSGTSPLVPDTLRTSEGTSVSFIVNTRANIADSDGDGLPDSWEIQNGLDISRNDANEDPDGDGLTNLQEYKGGTNPKSSDSPAQSSSISGFFVVNTAIYPFSLSADTDADSLPDWWEQKYGLNYLLNDAALDFDGDGLSNLTEYYEGRSPVLNESTAEVATVSASFSLNTREPRFDSDADGIPDAWEIAHGLDPLRSNANEDPDGDGRTNLEEYNAGTNPQVEDWRGPTFTASALFIVDTGGFKNPRTLDTDGDGMPDWWETQYGLNPQINDAFGDADGDGIVNLDEYNSGSSPALPDYPPVFGISRIFLVDTGGRSFDSDGDGLPDWWEKLYFNDPRLANRFADTDSDGLSNYAELLVGSNPVDPNSVLRITGLQVTRQTNSATVTIRWVSFQGGSYSIWSATEAQGPYNVLSTNISATPPLNTFTSTLGTSNHFFRVGVHQ